MRRGSGVAKPSAPAAHPDEPVGPRRWVWAGLAAVLAGGLALRLWGVRQGLPFAYNTDEADHFVPHAVAMFAGGTLNPHYFANPPAFTYVLHYLFALWLGGGAGVLHASRLNPQELYTLGRVAAALLGTGALWLLYVTGARLFGRAAGLLAAAIEAVAFLPVFYAHLALNDVPTLAPLTLSLMGSAGVLRKGRVRDHAIAGAGLGLACASKYTAGIALLPLAAAVAARYLDGEPGAARRALVGLATAAAVGLAAFLLANPYALLDYAGFHRELVHQSSLSAESQGKLGAPKSGGLAYYLWSLTWGLGWVPALAALGGAVTIWRHERRLGAMLVPAPLLFLAFMGLQGRYFGRWLLPIYPLLCLLAACFAATVARALGRLIAERTGRAAADRSIASAAGSRRGRVVAGVAWAAVAAALLAQGAIYSVHAGLVLSRPDTRNLARGWMLANIPLGEKIVVEPIAPNSWVGASPGAPGCPGRLWCKYSSELSRIAADGTLAATPAHKVTIEEYERTLAPALIGYYERTGYCWVISGSTQSARAFADPRAVPHAVAYYAALARQAQVVFRSSPYAPGTAATPFNFDWSFDYYPLAYHRPGPQVTIYRLHGGRCP